MTDASRNWNTMHPEVVNFAQVAGIVVFLVGSLASIAVLTNRAVLRATRRPEVSSGGQDDQRLRELQQSVDAIAVEVERIAESQRYTAKLLNERSEARTLSP